MGTPAWAYAVIAVPLLGGIGAILWSLGKGQSRTCEKCSRQMMPEWTQCLFCGHNPNLGTAQTGLLHFVSGPLKEQVASLDRSVTTIGSGPSNDIVLSDTGVSRRHVGIRKVDGGYELADFGSTNGVFVNGEKLPRKRLAVGDIIRVGTTEIVFRT